MVDVLEQFIADQFNRMIQILIVLLGIVCLAQGSMFYFIRDLQCTQLGSHGCLSWKENNILTKTGWTYYCFSQNIYVHTPNGPRTMSELQVGDQILGLDPNTGKRGYSKLEAWLHHDPLAEADFQLISTNANMSFESSEMHNLAFFGRNSQISYKFAKDFKVGDELVGFPEKNLRVTNIVNPIRRKGLFSPYTSFRNYFVYQDGFNPANSAQGEPGMILAHALSQVTNPEGKKTITKLAFWALSYFDGNFQPEKEQIYTHPLVSHLSWLYGSSWQEAHNSITYSHQYWHSRHSYHSYSSSSSSRRQQRQRNMVSSVIGAINAILSIVQL